MKKRKPPAPPPFTYSLRDLLLASPTAPLDAARRDHQLTRMWSGLASIELADVPSKDDWRVCSDAVNLLETLVVEIRQARLADGSLVEIADSSGLLADALDALAEAGRRHLAGAPIRLTAAGIQTVRAVLEDYAMLLEVLPARVIIQAHRLTERRIRELLAHHRRTSASEVITV